MRMATRTKLKQHSLKTTHVLIQGVGQVGLELAIRLNRMGSQLTLCDTDSNRIKRALCQVTAHTISPQQITQTDCDIFSPCAHGGILTNDFLEQCPAKLIIGAANNQLANVSAQDIKKNYAIEYLPDYIVNAGGLLYCVTQYFKLPPEYFKQKLRLQKQLLKSYVLSEHWD